MSLGVATTPTDAVPSSSGVAELEACPDADVSAVVVERERKILGVLERWISNAVVVLALHEVSRLPLWFIWLMLPLRPPAAIVVADVVDDAAAAVAEPTPLLLRRALLAALVVAVVSISLARRRRWPPLSLSLSDALLLLLLPLVRSSGLSVKRMLRGRSADRD